MKIILTCLILSATFLFAQGQKENNQIVGLNATYNIFLGDNGATYDNAPGIGLSYERSINNNFAAEVLVNYQRWGDVRNGSTGFVNNNYLDDYKIGLNLKNYLDSPDGYSSYLSLQISYNNMSYISDVSIGNNKFLRYSEDKAALGLEGQFGIRTGIYENIQVGAQANLGWLNLQNSTFYVGLQVGAYYNF